MTHPLKKCTGRMRIDQTGAYGDSTLPIDPDLVARRYAIHPGL